MPTGIYKRTETGLKNMSLARKGKKIPGMFKKGRIPSKEELEKLSIIRSKIKRSDKFKQNLSEYNRSIGKKPPTMKGEKHYNWKGGITPETIRLRHSIEYRLWRDSVFTRDNYTCIWCGDNKGGNLEADHILEWAQYPELRFAIDNGRTLCENCHHIRHGKKIS